MVSDFFFASDFFIEFDDFLGFPDSLPFLEFADLTHHCSESSNNLLKFGAVAFYFLPVDFQEDDDQCKGEGKDDVVLWRYCFQEDADIKHKLGERAFFERGVFAIVVVIDGDELLVDVEDNFFIL